MKVVLEKLVPDAGSSFKILLTPNLNELFYWHFHPEFEIVFVEAPNGIRHVGDHISRYEGSDLVFIGPNIPHLNFDYGVKAECEQVVVQMKEDFLGKDFFQVPEISQIRNLFERAKRGLSFYGETKLQAGARLKRISSLNQFDQLLELLRILELLAHSSEVTALDSRPVSNHFIGREQERMKILYRYIEEHYQEKIEVDEAAGLANLTKAAFCRYFKKTTRHTFTEFLNQYRINQAKKMLLHDKNVTEACFESGFENLSYFNKTFKKVTGENPSQFRKRHH
ncbi:MAG: AraC family transcriptional regulator [Bacteroidetes bacterium]|nr:MAG: AraC family transcriptional regulator [Bacteroidota bacterium]